MAFAAPGSKRPRGQPSQRAPLPGAGAQPHVSWWGEEGIPRLGATVQVLHEDGVWYPGTLAACEGTKWHIHFEDGDRDVYSLPNRDVKVMRQRPPSAEEWTRYLQGLGVAHAAQPREVLRDSFCKSRQSTARTRKPSDTYNEDGTPKEVAASSLPPFPSPDDELANVNGKAAQSDNGPALLNFSNFLGPESSEERNRKRARRGLELQFSEGIRARYPEAKLYAQLQELERKIDSISTRKRMQVQEALKHPGTSTRRLQIIVWNTHENQVPAGANEAEHAPASSSSGAGASGDKAPPSWTLFITGRVLDDNGDEATGEGQVTFSSLLERVFVELPAQSYPEGHAIEWNRSRSEGSGGAGGAAGPGGGVVSGAPTGLSIKREGAEECMVRVMVHCASDPKRFSLAGNPELGDLLGFESGSWAQLLAAFWAYVQDNSLHSDDDVLHVKLDEPLRQIFSEDRLPLRRVSERLSEMATQEQPIQVDYRLKLRGAVKPVVYEALVQVQDPIMLHMRELVQSIAQPHAAADELEQDEQIAALVSEVEARKRRRDFMAAFADRPLPLLHDLVCSLALDLATVRCEGSSRHGALNGANLERAPVWQQPWTEEAVLHYLNMQGCHVALKVEDSLLEEDASALAQQDAAVKYGGLLSKDALNRYPPYVPGSSASGGGRAASRVPPGTGVTAADEFPFECKLCDRRFKSHHALSVHFATSAAHKSEKDDLKAAGWKAENAGVGADAGGGASAQGGLPANTPGASGLDAKERGATVWNDLQRQMKGKGFTQEELKNMYSQLRKNENH